MERAAAPISIRLQMDSERVQPAPNPGQMCSSSFWTLSPIMHTASLAIHEDKKVRLHTIERDAEP